MLIRIKFEGYARDGTRRYPFDLGGDAPDNSGINAAALQSAELSKEQLAFIKDVYAEGKPARATASAAAMRQSALQETATGQQIALTGKYAGQQDKQFGYEDSLRADANAYDSPERQAANADKAMVGVQASMDNTQAQSQRNLARMGINPNSGKSLAMSGQLGIQKAVALAGAANKARTDTEAQGYARKMDSANLGRNLASSQATSANTAMTLGNSSVSNAQVPLTVASNGASMMNSGFSGAGSLNASSGNLYGQSAQLTNAANSQGDALMGTLGQLGGAFIASSDVRLKTNIKGINPDAALKAINHTPVSSWKYRRGSKADDGGQEHTGPMAQDARRTMGEKAAPGGTTIDLITMNGMTMAAIQALSQKVDRLAGPRGMKRSAA